MNLILSLAIAVMFGSGAYLMLKHDLLRMVVGVILISNSANLLLMSSGLSRGVAPIHPIADGMVVSDPVVQALTLTAIVITFGVAAILLGLVHRVHATHQTLDMDELARAEVEAQADLEHREE